MRAIMVFHRSPELPSLSELAHSMNELLGLGCGLIKEDKLIPAGDYEDAGKEVHEARLYVELPDLEEDEGDPVVHYQAIPRLDRDEAIAEIIDEIVAQEPALREAIDANVRDILLTCEESFASYDAASALAYVVASETECGLLVISDEDEEGTVWFSDAESFWEAEFGDDEDDDGADFEGDDEEE